MGYVYHWIRCLRIKESDYPRVYPVDALERRDSVASRESFKAPARSWFHW